MTGSRRATIVTCFAIVYLVWGSTYLVTKIGVKLVSNFMKRDRDQIRSKNNSTGLKLHISLGITHRRCRGIAALLAKVR